jgi:hypothetical protein
MRYIADQNLREIVNRKPDGLPSLIDFLASMDRAIITCQFQNTFLTVKPNNISGFLRIPLEPATNSGQSAIGVPVTWS